jgi:aspartyl-tRNA(Asn)/glutamyl-tRNA(Gln) amidotransferase subunit B
MIANWIINKKGDINFTPAQFVDQIIKTSTIENVADDVLQTAIQSVIAANSKAVSDYKSGKQQALMFLFGNVLKELNGKGDKKKIMEMVLARVR